jgi:predicted aspartyl protease
MPTIHATIGAFGPVIDITVKAPSAIVQGLVAQGIQPPVSRSGHGLIDTGASQTAIDPDVLKQLQAPLVRQVTVQGAAISHRIVGVYVVELEFPSTHSTSLHRFTLPVIGARPADQGIDALIGRDILQACILIYDGPQNHLTLVHP